MTPFTFKRSPIVPLRTFVAIEALALVLYLAATGLDEYKYQIYIHLPLLSSLSYEALKFFFLSGTQFVITVYAFLRWYYEAYTLRPDAISHQRGVFVRSTRTIPLKKSVTLTISSGPLGKLLHYGSIHIQNDTPYNSMVLADISYPQKQLKLIEKYMNGPQVSNEPPDIRRLISQGEHEHLEFKSSLRFDTQSRQVNRELEKAAMKTVAAFLNTQGGYLVLGVDDAGRVSGLLPDYGTIQHQNSDGFENHFTQVFNSMIGPEFRHLVKLFFHKMGGDEICVIQVVPGTRPAYLKLDNSEHFYVRTGNISTSLKFSEVEVYARSRWPRRVLT